MLTEKELERIEQLSRLIDGYSMKTRSRETMKDLSDVLGDLKIYKAALEFASVALSQSAGYPDCEEVFKNCILAVSDG